MGCTHSRPVDVEVGDNDGCEKRSQKPSTSIINGDNKNVITNSKEGKKSKISCGKIFKFRHTITTSKLNDTVKNSNSEELTKPFLSATAITTSDNNEKSLKDCNVRQQQQQQQQRDNLSNYPNALSLDDDTLKRIIRCFPFPHQSNRGSAGSGVGGANGGSANSSPRTIVKVTKNFASNLRNGFNNVRNNSNTNVNNISNNVEKINNSNCSSNPNNRSFSDLLEKSSGSVSTNYGGSSMQTLSIMVAKSLEATVPILVPWESWLRKRLSSWVQLSGHEGTIVPATEQTLWKKRAANDSNESNAYIKLMDDICCPFVPRFFREVEYKDELFIEIEDLSSHFYMPAIMDVKLGTRTFLESEVTNPVKRKDLYTKMVNLDSNEPTVEEHADQAITKLRYMQFREQESSTATLGFRIDGIKERYVSELNKNFKKVKTRAQIIDVLCRFLGPNNEKVRQTLLERLKCIRSKIGESEFFRSHEVVGTSLLIMYDDNHAGAWMIDFAKALPVDQNISIDHRTTWRLGNHEDGYLYGLDNFIQVMEDTKLKEIPSIR